MPPVSYSDLQGAPVLITGGSQGIGEAMVRAFAAQGARIFFCDIDAARGEALASALAGQVCFQAVDLREEKAVRDWIAGVVEALEGTPVRALINNAARDPRLPLADCTADAWDDLMALNLRAYFLTAREVAPHLASPGGSIINFSSCTFYLAPAHMTAYVATKAGAQGLTRALARELGPRGIRVNTISPGWVMTERQVRDLVDDEARAFIDDRQCVPDLLQPEEIADVALFLASGASRAITGQELLADRGMCFS
ncbi:MAG: SDR family oxidoreductase [Verrucomicrobiales bacterium]